MISLFDGLLILLAIAGQALIFVHGIIMDKIGLRQLWEKSSFLKELFHCSMCCGTWFGVYGILCAYLNIIHSFWFYVLTLPFAGSAFSYFWERSCIMFDEFINKEVNKKTPKSRIFYGRKRF